MRDLQQNPCAVSRQWVAAARAAVLEVGENRQPLVDDVARRLAADVDDETDAARVVLEAGS